MRLSDFDFQVPEELIAKFPVKQRDHSRLMVLDRAKNSIAHKRFYNLPDYLNPGDLLVVNETKVYPARLWALKDRTEAKVEVFLLRELENNLWEVMVKPARKVRIGNKLTIAEGVQCDVIDNTVSGGRVVRFNNIPREVLYKLIDAVGQSPCRRTLIVSRPKRTRCVIRLCTPSAAAPWPPRPPACISRLN